VSRKLTTLTAILIGLTAQASANGITSTEVHNLSTMVVTGQHESSTFDLDSPSEAGSRLGLSAKENPASVAIANRELMSQIGARDLQDTANILPGVNLAKLPGSGAFASLRGFTGSQVNHLFNGIPLAYVISARPVDSWLYDRVESVGGPSSFLYGASSVGGSLNYVTKTAERMEQEITGQLSYGRFDTRKAAIGINQALTDNNWIRFDYSKSDSNGYIDRNESRTDSLAFSWLSDINDKLTHTLAFEYQEEEVDSPYWGTPTLNPQIDKLVIDKSTRYNNYNVQDGLYEQRVRWLRSVTDYEFNDKTALRNTLYHYRSERNYRNLEKYKYSNDNATITRSAGYQQRHEQEMTGNRIELTHNAELFNNPSDWAFGLDYNVNEHTGFPSGSGTFDTVDAHNFTPDYFADLGIGSLTEGRSNRVKIASVFVENRQGLTERLSLISALRYDHIDFSLKPAPGSAETTSRWDTFSGRLGIVFALNDDVSFYGQYSTSAEPPGGTLTTSSNSTIDEFDISKGRQFEIGAKFNYFDDRGVATVAVYHIIRENFLVSDPNDSSKSLQVGQQTSKGIELASSFQFTPKFRADGNIAFVRAEYDEFFEGGVSYHGNTPKSVPNRVANLWLINQPTTDWQLGLGTRYVASVNANNANTQKLASYTLFDAYARYSVNTHLDVTLRGRNLYDKLYAYVGSSTQYYVGEPRSVELTLDLKY
tara:strand:- start:1707 stop:3830 length:2124 start_codon:yes stop_codon:yes gene_type:complete